MGKRFTTPSSIETIHEEYKMKINHFEDTDTLHIVFTEHPVAETQEMSENVYIDLDERGNVVSMTIEHAEENANILEFAFERRPKVST